MVAILLGVSIRLLVMMIWVGVALFPLISYWCDIVLPAWLLLMPVSRLVVMLSLLPLTLDLAQLQLQLLYFFICLR
jgi:hypothetical protein